MDIRFLGLRPRAGAGLTLAMLLTLIALVACGPPPDVVPLRTLTKADLNQAKLFVDGEAVEGTAVDITETTLIVYGASVDATDDRPVLAAWPILGHVPLTPDALLLTASCATDVGVPGCRAPERSDACDSGCRCAEYAFGWWEMDAVVLSLGAPNVGEPSTTLRVFGAPAADHASEQLFCETPFTASLAADAE